ncbi:hypothetical protein EHM76_01340 [bacterium]|nr:MAG: hypothetical protein EHM76_01340 [bacterium]
MKKIWKVIISLAGLPPVFIYSGFSLAAYQRFPGLFLPTNCWLSDLGDVSKNPTGAWLYNLGILLTAFFMLLFFLGFSQWKLKRNRIQNWMVSATQVFGGLGCLAMGMSAVFPINLAQHGLWSIALYMLLGTAFVFSVAAFRYLPACPRWVLILGIATALLDCVSGFFGTVKWLEWAVVGSFIFYMLALSGLAVQRMCDRALTTGKSRWYSSGLA